MSYCQPWLDCNAIEDQIKLTQKDVGNGLGKMFSKAELDGMKVAFIRTREDKLTSGELSKLSLVMILNSSMKHFTLNSSQEWSYTLIGVLSKVHFALTANRIYYVSIFAMVHVPELIIQDHSGTESQLLLSSVYVFNYSFGDLNTILFSF